MSTLFSTLHVARSAYQAQLSGVAVAGNNTANVNTEGYSRQVVDLSVAIGGGVKFGDPYRLESEHLSGRERRNTAKVGFAESQSEALTHLERTLTDPEIDPTNAMAELFGKLSQVASAPMDTTLRDSAVSAARAVALHFNRHSDNIQQARSDADARISDLTAEANVYIAEIVETNRLIILEGNQVLKEADGVLKDRRDVAVVKLAKLVGGKAMIDHRDEVRFMLSSGEVLVDGVDAGKLATQKVGGTGFLQVYVVDKGASIGSYGSRDITTLREGAMGGELEFRDETAATAATDLDRLAFDVVTHFNTVHQANADLSGTTGNDFFTVLGSATGAAKNMAIDPSLRADSSRLASSAPATGPGNNSGILALVALKDQNLASSSSRTFLDESIRIVTAIGQAGSSATSDLNFAEAQRDLLVELRDSLSGVSIQEELADLTRFQHAAQAASRLMAVVSELLGSIISIA